MSTRFGHFVRILVLGGAALLLGACVTEPALQAPEGFAVYSEVPSDTVLRAVSPEGVAFRVRTVENDPPQTLEFWSEALSVHLGRSGYALLEPRVLEAPIGEVRAFEWVAPVGGEEWIYLTAIARDESRIVVVEAAGSYDHFSLHRDAILESLETLGPGSGP